MMFVKQCRIIQCFDCYNYEHIGKKPKNVTKCHYCIEKHETNRCNKNEKEITDKSINCEDTKSQI